MIRWLSYSLSLFLVGFLSWLLVLIGTQAFHNLFSGTTSVLHSSLWNYRHEMFGFFSMAFGTLCVAAVALAIAVPLSLGCSIFLSEFLKGKWRALSKVTIELLASVPSIVIGLIGVIYIRPWLAPLHTRVGSPSPDSLFTAGVVLSVMLLPTLTSLMDDAFRCVARHYRETGFGLGMTRVEVALKIVLPQAKSGVVGAILLAVGRALGETVAVFLVVGRSDRPFELKTAISSLFEAGQTITSKLGGSEIAIAYGDPTHWQALMAIGFLLWITVGANTYASLAFLNRRREAGE